MGSGGNGTDCVLEWEYFLVLQVVRCSQRRDSNTCEREQRSRAGKLAWLFLLRCLTRTREYRE